MNTQDWFRVNNITEEYSEDKETFLLISLQSVSTYNGIKFTTAESSPLIDREYSFIKEYIEKIDPQKYSDIEFEDVTRNIGNRYYNPQVNYIYSFYYKVFFFTKNRLFLWNKNEWGLKIEPTGYASAAEVSNMGNLNDKIIAKSEELRRKGDPQFWKDDFSKVIYSVPSDNSNKIYLKFSNVAWFASKDKDNWVSATSMFNGDFGKIGTLSDSDLKLILSLYTKNFNDGLDILLNREVTGYLDTL